MEPVTDPFLRTRIDAIETVDASRKIDPFIFIVDAFRLAVHVTKAAGIAIHFIDFEPVKGKF